MRRRKGRSKFKHSRSYSKPLFDPQRLLYFSTQNQRQGKVIRPKTTAVSQRATTQTVDDQEEVLGNLNQTLQFRINNREGYRQKFQMHEFENDPEMPGLIHFKDNLISCYFDRSVISYSPLTDNSQRLLCSSFAPYTPNLGIILNLNSYIKIPRPADSGLLDVDIHFVRAILDTTLIDDKEFYMSQIEDGILDDINLQSFTHWDNQEQDITSAIYVDIKFDPFLVVGTQPLANDVNWLKLSANPFYNQSTKVIEFESHDPTRKATNTSEAFMNYLNEGLDMTVEEDGKHNIYTSQYNEPRRYHLVEFLYVDIEEPEPIPPATTVPRLEGTYTNIIFSTVLTPKLIRS